MLLALAIGAAGGALFNWLTLPLPWMLGPMLLNLVAAVAGLPVRGPVFIRPYVVVVIGVMLGSGFTPDILGRLQEWTISLAGLAVYLAACGAVTVPFYRKAAKFDPTTSYFAGMPGGLNEMVVVGGAMGGDDRAIALAHATRILLVVFLVAFWFRWVEGLALGDRSAMGTPFAAIPPIELAILAAAGVAGFFLGRALAIPAPTLIGPMLVSAALHLADLTRSPPPVELVIGAQVLLGTIIGCRFAGMSARRIGSAFLFSFGATTLMLALTAFFAVALHRLLGLDILQVVLAYAPGGLAEMSLVALAMKAEVAYVATHHMLRIMLVILCAPLVFPLLSRIRRSKGGGDD